MRTPFKLGIFLVLLLAGAAIGVGFLERNRESSLSTFVITETTKYTSLDPLDGDSSQNLPVVRMLYATPLEILPDNTLGSQVLESFEYDRATKSIKWTVKTGLKYSDKTAITPEDVAFAVARMAFVRPGFPLLKFIKGLDVWLKIPTPLSTFPDGLRVNGNDITIQLTENYPHPLFRFSVSA
jgi:ABC-type transport system substrate-binding protein